MLSSIKFYPHEDIYKGIEERCFFYTFIVLKLLVFIAMRSIICKARIKYDKHKKVKLHELMDLILLAKQY